MTSYVKVDLWVKVKLGIGVVLTLACVNVTDCVAEDSEAIVGILGAKNERLISIATGLSQPVKEAPSVATVIDADDIERIGAVTLDQILETVPGIHVTPVRGFFPSFIVRGIFSFSNNNLLILVDGIPMTDAVSGSLLLTHGMLAKNISRIEIVRGPGSAVYGQDAFAGVINIVTKDAGEIDGTTVGSFAGNFDTYGGWFLFGDKIGQTSVSLSVQGRTTDGQSERINFDAQSQLDQVFNTTASLAPGSINTGRDDVDVQLKVSNNDWYDVRFGYRSLSNVGNGAGTLLALDPAGEFNIDLWTSSLTLKKNVADFDVKADISYTGYRFASRANLLPAGAFGGVFQEPVRNDLSYDAHHARADFSAAREFGDHRLRTGVGYASGFTNDVNEKRNFLLAPGNIAIPAGQFEAVDALGETPFGGEEERHVYYALLQEEWRFLPDWILTAGLRYDHYSDFGGTLSPRASLVWNIDYTWTTKLIYGRAFRAPSFFELHTNPGGLLVRGNPDLDPETVNTIELALLKSWQSGLSSDMNLYWYETDDLIVETPVSQESPNTLFFANADGVSGYGVELDLGYPIFQTVSLNVDYAFQNLNALDDATERVTYVSPRHQIYTQLDWNVFPKWHVDVRANWVLGRQRPDDDPRNNDDDYATVGVTLRGENLWDALDLSLSVNNIFDEKGSEPSLNFSSIPNDYPIAGINALGQIGIHF